MEGLESGAEWVSVMIRFSQHLKISSFYRLEFFIPIVNKIYKTTLKQLVILHANITLRRRNYDRTN